MLQQQKLNNKIVKKLKKKYAIRNVGRSKGVNSIFFLNLTDKNVETLIIYYVLYYNYVF
jgi:hypothetical protein